MSDFEQQVFELLYDSKDSVRQADAFSRSLEAQSRVLRSLTGVTTEYDEAGQALTKTLLGLDASGNKIRQTYRGLYDENNRLVSAQLKAESVISASNKKTADSYKEFNNTVGKAIREYRKALTDANKLQLASPVERGASRSAFEKIIKEAKLAGVSVKEFNNIVEKVSVGDLGALPAKYQAVANAVLNAAKASSTLGTAAERGLAAADKSIKNRQVSEGQAIIAINRRMAAEEKAARQKEVSEGQAIAAINKRTLAEEKASRRRQEILGQELANDANRRQAQLLQAQLVSSLGAKGIDLQGARNPQAAQTIASEQARLANLVAAGKLTRQQVIEVGRAIENNLIKGFVGAEKQAADSFGRIKQSIGELEKQTEKTGNFLNLTWESVGRLLLAHVLYGGLYKVQSALIDSTKEAITFQQKIAEIQTISQNVPQTFADWQNQIRSLSDTYGSDLLDVAAGAYETISNQIADGARSAQFLNTALRFSAATASTTAQSVDLLSSVLNSFQLKAESAEKVAAVLFKVIDLGRVKAEEMANTFGRIGPIASQLGISLEELGGSITQLTIQGVKFDVASTGISNIMLKLLKPTESLNELFAEWGVTSGQAAVATFGFTGVLEKLSKATDGSLGDLATIFKDLRAIRGIVPLIGNEDLFAGYKEAVEEIKRSNKEFDEAVKLTTDNSGKRLIIAGQRIKNFFTVDVSNSIVETVADIDRLGDGTSFLAKTVETLTSGFAKLAVVVIGNQIAKTLVAGFSATGSTMLAVERRAISLQRLLASGGNAGILTPLVNAAPRAAAGLSLIKSAGANVVDFFGGPWVIGITAAITAVSYLYTKEQERITDLRSQADNELNSFIEREAKKRSEFTKTLDLEAKIRTDQLSFQERNVLQYFAKISSAYNKNAKEIATVEKNIVDITRQATEDKLAAVTRTLTAYRKGIEDLDKKLADFKAKTKEIAADEKDQKFDLTLGLIDDPQKKLEILAKEINSLFERQSEALSKNAVDEAIRLQTRLDALVTQGRQIGIDTRKGDGSDPISAYQANTQTAVEERFQRKISETLEGRAKTEERIAEIIGRQKDELRSAASVSTSLKAELDVAAKRLGELKPGDFESVSAFIEARTRLISEIDSKLGQVPGLTSSPDQSGAIAQLEKRRAELQKQQAEQGFGATDPNKIADIASQVSELDLQIGALKQTATNIIQNDEFLRVRELVASLKDSKDEFGGNTANADLFLERLKQLKAITSDLISPEVKSQLTLNFGITEFENITKIQDKLSAAFTTTSKSIVEQNSELNRIGDTATVAVRKLIENNDALKQQITNVGFFRSTSSPLEGSGAFGPGARPGPTKEEIEARVKAEQTVAEFRSLQEQFRQSVLFDTSQPLSTESVNATRETFSQYRAAIQSIRDLSESGVLFSADVDPEGLTKSIGAISNALDELTQLSQDQVSARQTQKELDRNKAILEKLAETVGNVSGEKFPELDLAGKEVLKTTTEIKNSILEGWGGALDVILQAKLPQLRAELNAIAAAARAVTANLSGTASTVPPETPVGFRNGDIVPPSRRYGNAPIDSVPALLMPGEFIVKREIAQKNIGFLRDFNAGRVKRFAEGGSTFSESELRRRIQREQALAKQRAAEEKMTYAERNKKYQEENSTGFNLSTNAGGASFATAKGAIEILIGKIKKFFEVNTGFNGIGDTVYSAAQPLLDLEFADMFNATKFKPGSVKGPEALPDLNDLYNVGAGGKVSRITPQDKRDRYLFELQGRQVAPGGNLLAKDQMADLSASGIYNNLKYPRTDDPFYKDQKFRDKSLSLSELTKDFVAIFKGNINEFVAFDPPNKYRSRDIEAFAEAFNMVRGQTLPFAFDGNARKFAEGGLVPHVVSARRPAESSTTTNDSSTSFNGNIVVNASHSSSFDAHDMARTLKRAIRRGVATRW